MATRWGWATLKWLEHRGWKMIPLQSGVIGDPQVEDPVTHRPTNLYEAAKLQRDRTGEYPDFLKENVNDE